MARRRAPRSGELEKAARHGREPARVELARAARAAALQATSPEEFVAVLRASGYLVELRRAPSGDPLGYKLARLGDVTAAGVLVFYSGSKLAPDLSLPRLQQRWAALDAGLPDGPVEVGDVWGAAGAVLERGPRRGRGCPARHSVGRSSRRGRGHGGGVHRALRCRAKPRPGAGHRCWTPPAGTTGRPARPAVRPSRWARPGSGCAGSSRCAGRGGGTPGGLSRWWSRWPR
jgi:hypothetical protein